jgi:site-specific DNA-cytosine methylase
MDYIDWTDTEAREPPNYGKKLIASTPTIPIVNLGFRQNSFKNSTLICPCILATSSDKLWNTLLSRYCNNTELLCLQGFDNKIFTIVVSSTQLNKQIGNSISVNVLKGIIKQLI